MTTQTKTQDFRELDIVKNGKEWIVAVETKRRTIHARVDDLEKYVKEQGFKHKGVWYFRKSWMKEDDARVFERAGLMKRVGTVSSLREEIPFPDGRNYNGTNVIYQLNLPNGN